MRWEQVRAAWKGVERRLARRWTTHRRIKNVQAAQGLSKEEAHRQVRLWEARHDEARPR